MHGITAPGACFSLSFDSQIIATFLFNASEANMAIGAQPPCYLPEHFLLPPGDSLQEVQHSRMLVALPLFPEPCGVRQGVGKETSFSLHWFCR